MDTSKRFFCAILLLSFVAQAKSQGNKFFIEFKDKAGTPYNVSRPEEYLTQASIARRSLYNIRYAFTDLPVTPSYITRVAAVPHTIVWYASKWMNGVVVSFDAQVNESDALAEIATLPFVRSSSKVRRYRRIEEPVDSASGNRSKFTSVGGIFDYGGSYEQARQLNIPCLHEKNYRGQGMVIGVLDAGFSGASQNSAFDSLRLSGRLAGTRDFVSGGTNVYQGSEHGTAVLSCMAALKPGVAIGTAPLATYWLMRTEEGAAETISEEYNWIRGAEFADSVGCDILTTSLGYTEFNDPTQNHVYETDLNGRTAPMSIAATIASRVGMFVLNAAGNEGDKPWKHISVPGDADSICTVGSVDPDNEYSVFSSVGPTADGRIKPDLVACGERAWVCDGNGNFFPGNGTSFATPVLAGAVACYWQANKKLDNMRMLSRLKNNASNKGAPNNKIGWGIADMCAAVNGSFDFNAYTETDKIVLQMQDADYEYLNVEVYDLLGKQICKMDTKGTELKLGFITPDLAPGIYIIRVETPYGKKSKKIRKLDL
jgi:serine protease AprX